MFLALILKQISFVFLALNIVHYIFITAIENALLAFQGFLFWVQCNSVFESSSYKWWKLCSCYIVHWLTFSREFTVQTGDRGIRASSHYNDLGTENSRYRNVTTAPFVIAWSHNKFSLRINSLKHFNGFYYC